VVETAPSVSHSLRCFSDTIRRTLAAPARRDEDDRRAAVARRAEQQLPQMLAADRVHAAGELVGDDHRPSRHERAGDGDAPRLSAGERAGVVS
jgi:hypothetical protein